LVRRASRAYHLACARDDAASRRFVVPEGVWVCAGCDEVLLDAREMPLHTAHGF